MTGNVRMTAVTLGLVLAALIAAKTRAAPPPDPKPCEPGAITRTDPSAKPPETKDPGKNEPNTTGSAGSDNLSDKLSRGDGVLCPPNVDSEMASPPPRGGKTPVIPPPGSPGGDPNVQPK